MIKKIDHIGIAVNSLEESLKFYEGALGLKVENIEEVSEQKVKVCFLNIGGVHFELLEPTSPDSTVAKSIEKRGEGIHHIAVLVENIDEAIKTMKEKEIKLIDEIPRKGAGGSKMAFVHPKSTHGILLELYEK
ncbi:MAG: Glyoxalase/Bleomycin resistance protein/Dioxygenase superfamily protein [Candidatus Methanofastidiosum methylothiophilum]|jgi:methylmalonyl-CoA epimerase|uniref:Glyoxalase/Bleomycin resistance protein/Dioxygenase superfamily protein n=1 Tax=Candidatus Methanofastidiosum methylothiophilum TaxID=1705564 RepID=A0A150J316_9EURY|nr:MAG: Glyoxalase/Bleomycin resistance protein/Dioxygenase superfamily protein [Candidatus Methanofastidiosum methylthiophilus]NMC76158.1 methylmalonyl-CoA epimerase [Candidatus Methanofastidiosa archaeon]